MFVEGGGKPVLTTADPVAIRVLDGQAASPFCEKSVSVAPHLSAALVSRLSPFGSLKSIFRAGSGCCDAPLAVSLAEMLIERVPALPAFGLPEPVFTEAVIVWTVAPNAMLAPTSASTPTTTATRTLRTG